MGVGDKDLADEILVLGRHARAALAAAPLRPVGVQRHALDVAAMGHGHHHVLALDQVLVLDLADRIHDLGAPRCRELVLHRNQFIADDALELFLRAQRFEIILDLLAQALQLIPHLVAAKGREALQAQIENGTGLLFAHPQRVAVGQHVTRVRDQPHQRGHVCCRPVACHQLRARRRRVRRIADQADHLVDIRHRNGKTNQHMCALARLAKLMLGPPRHHFLAERQEGLDEALQRQHFRPAAIERDHVAAE